MQHVTSILGHRCPSWDLVDTNSEKRQRELLVKDKNNYRHIDTAQYYRNEVGVGQAIKASGLPKRIFHHNQISNIRLSCDKGTDCAGFKEFATDYIDLMLIHWVVSDYEGTTALQAYQVCQLKQSVCRILTKNKSKEF